MSHFLSSLLGTISCKNPGADEEKGTEEASKEECHREWKDHLDFEAGGLGSRSTLFLNHWVAWGKSLTLSGSVLHMIFL
jgi:hypothetical protein